MSRTYPAKIILLGEHTVLCASQALAVPYPKLMAEWSQAASTDDRLLRFAAFLQNELQASWLNHQQLQMDLQAGWQLKSSVPNGYGVGSSGTVCAAIYDRYNLEDVTGTALRQRLASMEVFFHGNSSGTDPFISYTGQQLLLSEVGVTSIKLPENWQQGFFLLDTGFARDAGPLIAQLLQRYQSDPDWKIQVDKNWAAPTDAAIAALMVGEYLDFRRFFSLISDFQITALPDYIPSGLHSCWKGNNYCLKLCGAGGGGFVLGYYWGSEFPIPELVDFPHFFI